jgi:hypothetical protein
VDLQVDTRVSEKNVSVFRNESGDVFSAKRYYLPTSQHGVTTFKTNIGMFVTVRTPDLTTA